MRIAALLEKKRPFISLEFFPPKDRAKWPDFFRGAEELRAIDPLFVSVTYGAMGGTRAHTLEIVSRLKNEFKYETMAHLTCIGTARQDLDSFLAALVEEGIDNVLALRGDPPRDGDRAAICDGDFRCAADLVGHIRDRYPGLGIAVAAYPEGHPEAPSREEDLEFLKFKLDRGADFAITQLFFENATYWDFVRRGKAIGIEKPIIPGILPIFSLASIERIVSLCGAAIPADYLARLRAAHERGGVEAVKRLGVAYAGEQARGLLEAGAPGVHLYTLNRADACLDLASGLRS